MNKTRFVYIGKVMPDVHWHNQYSVHPHHELIVILGGVMHISGKTQNQTLRAGDAALYPAGVHHWEQSDENEPVESCFIVFEDPDFSADEILVCRNQDGLLRPLAAALYERSLTMQDIPCADDYLRLMLKIFHAGTAAPDDECEFIRKIHTFMRKHLAEPVTLEDLAAAAGLTKYHFLRQYRGKTGKTPVQVLWEIRCSEAVSLLKYTALPIKEIAARTGFSDLAHFSRRIKAFSGLIPREFRKIKD